METQSQVLNKMYYTFMILQYHELYTIASYNLKQNISKLIDKNYTSIEL